jgi:hypothetical protein
VITGRTRLLALAARAKSVPTVTGRDTFAGQLRELGAFFGYPFERT